MKPIKRVVLFHCETCANCTRTTYGLVFRIDVPAPKTKRKLQAVVPVACYLCARCAPRRHDAEAWRAKMYE